MVYRLTSFGMILVLFVPLTWLREIQDNQVPRPESNVEFISERNDQDFTDDVYGFINDLVKRSTKDNRNRILPTRQMNKNPTVFIQESETPKLHESFSQNRAVQESVANKNEGTRKTSGTMKDKQSDCPSNRAPQGLGTTANREVLQLSLIRGPRDKQKKSSLAHDNTHLQLLPKGSSSVFITSVVLPSRTRSTNHAQATAVVYDDLEKGLIRGSPLPGTIQGISDEYVTRIDERASSYVSTSASTLKYEELQLAPTSEISSSSSSSLTSSTMASSSLTSSTSSLSLSSPSSSSLTQTSSSVLPLILDSKELPSSSSSSSSSSSAPAATVPASLAAVTFSSFIMESKGLSSSSPSSSPVAAAKSSSRSASVMLGSSRNDRSRPRHQVRITEAVPTPVSTPLLQLSSSAETPSVLSSQINQTFSPSSSSTTAKEASPLWSSHLNQALSSSPSSSSSSPSSSSSSSSSSASSPSSPASSSSSSASSSVSSSSSPASSSLSSASSSVSSSSSSSASSSEAAGTEIPLLLSSQLHQGFSSLLTLSSSLSSTSLSSSLSSSSLSLSSLSSTTSRTIAILPIKPSHLYEGVLPPSSSVVTASLSMTQEFSLSSSSTGETPAIVTTLQNQDHSFSSLSLETPFSPKNRESSKSTTSTKTEIAKSLTGHGTLMLPSPLVTSKTRVSPSLSSQQNIYLSSLSKQDVISNGKFISRDKKATLGSSKSTTTTLSVPTHSVSLGTNMSAMRSSVLSSTLPVKKERVSSVPSPISLPTPSSSVRLTMASLEPSKIPSSSISSLIQTESSRPSASFLSATLKHVIGRIKPTSSLAMQYSSTDAVKSDSSRYLPMSLSPSPSSSAPSSISFATFKSGSSSSTTTTTTTTTSSSSISSKLSIHSVVFTSPSTTTKASSTSSSQSLLSAKFLSFSSTSLPIPTSSSLSSSPSLHDYQSPFQLVTTSTLSYLLKSAIPSASPTPSLPNAHSTIQSSSSVSPSKHNRIATTWLNSKISRSYEGNKIDDKTEQTSLQFILTSILSGQQAKASMTQETSDLSSSNLSTDFNGPSFSQGSVIKRTMWTPSTKPFRSQTENSTAMSTNRPLNELNETLSIVSSIDGFPHTHHAKRHQGMSSISASATTSVPSKWVGLTVDTSRKVNFIKTAETQPTLIKASPTAVSKSKGIHTKSIANPSLVMEDSRASETGTYGLHTKELASSKDTMSMRGSLTTEETGVSVSSRILVSTISPDIPKLTRTLQTVLRKQTKGAVGSTSPTSTFSKYFVSFPKSSSLDYGRHTKLQNAVPIFSTQEELALTRSSATLKSSMSTSGGFPDVSKSVSKETRSKPLDKPQDTMAMTAVEMTESTFSHSMTFHSISPTSTLYTFPSSTSITDGNISMVITSDGTNPGTKSNDGPNNEILLFIIIAIIPTLILLILIAVFLFRRVKERESEPFYKIQVEYTDDNKQRRPRCANSRLDLTIKGMHIDLEFPSPGEKRKSARLSAAPNLSDAQMRELQKLSLECKENLEWINEVLERELDTPVFLGGSSSSENDNSMDTSCTNQRYSVYSACSEKEKENYEVSEKITVCDSPKHMKYSENEMERNSYLQNDADDNNDSETFKDDSDELKIQLDQRASPKVPPKPQKPEIPPKPKIKLTATDAMGTLANPLTSRICIECSACEEKSKGKNKFDPVLSKNNTPKERKLLKKPPIPERKGTLVRKPEKTRRRSEVSLTVENEVKKDSPCLCNRLSTSKPPLPKKPEGLVINRFERKASDGTNGRVTTTLYRSGMKLNVCCAPRKACQAV